MPSTSAVRASVVRACLLALSAAAGPPEGDTVITVGCGGSRIVYTVTAVEARAVLGPPAVEGLSVLAGALLGRLTDVPLTAKRLARESGYSMGSHVYAALRELEGRGLAIKTHKGYQLRP